MTTPGLPEHPVAASLDEDSGRWVLTMERELHHPPEAVWAALTEAEQIVHWAPYAPDRDLDTPGEVALPEAGDETSTTRGVVQVAEAPRLLVLSWDEDELRFELTPTATGTVLRFTHVFADRGASPSYAAGWHLCLAALMAVLQGVQVPPVTGEAARARGWENYRQQYEALLVP